MQANIRSINTTHTLQKNKIKAKGYLKAKASSAHARWYKFHVTTKFGWQLPIFQED